VATSGAGRAVDQVAEECDRARPASAAADR
jgi:hypothetical protein